MKKLTFYTVNDRYCEYLRNFDPKAPIAEDEKHKRPFVGILLQIDNMPYFAPLTSPKSKHTKMKNSIDFHKINGGKYGAINFNNMIPIHINSLTKADLKVYSTDNKSTKDYKILLQNQMSWCTSNQDLLRKKAEDLYNFVQTTHPENPLLKRCCNFKEDEKVLQQYCSEKGWEL